MLDYKSPFAIHKEIAARNELAASQKPTPNLSGREIACVVGGYGETPIPALFDPATRTVFPVRKQ